MNPEVMLALGVALFVAARVLYRIFRDDDKAILPWGTIQPLTPWMLALMVATGAGLSVYSVTQLDWFERLFSVSSASSTIKHPHTGTPSTPVVVQPHVPDTAPVDTASAGAAGDDDSLTESSRSVNEGEVLPDNTTAPGDWLRDWSGLLALIFAALGIVMTLVTTIVISVSRSAVEDIRRMDERMHSKKNEIFAEFKKEQEKCQEQFKGVADDIARTRVQANFVLSMFRAHIANYQEIQAHRSNQQSYSRLLSTNAAEPSNSDNAVTIRNQLSKFYLLGSDNIYSQCEYAEFLSKYSSDISSICLEEDLGYLKAVIDNLYCWLKHEKNQSADQILMKRVPEAVLKLEEMKMSLSKSLWLPS